MKFVRPKLRGITAFGLCVSLVASTLLGPVALAADTHSADLEKDSSQYLSIADGSQTGLDLSGSLTLEAWVKLESQPVNGGSEMAIIDKFDGDNNARSYALRYVSVSGTYKLRLHTSSAGNTNTETDVAATLPNGEWHHVAVSKSGSTATFYVDGVSVGSGSADSSIYNGSATFAIGATVGNSADGFFDGLIDEVKVWNVARSGSDILTDKGGESSGSETGLVGYWKLNNSLSDSTSDGNTLTNNNSATFSTDVPSFVVEALTVRKSADESISSSTVLQNDDDLKVTLLDSRSYIIDGVMFVSSTESAPDLKLAFSAPSGANVAISYAHGADEGVLSSNVTSSRIMVPKDRAIAVRIQGTVVMGGNAGDLQLKWAQANSNATAITVIQGSYLRAQRVQ